MVNAFHDAGMKWGMRITEKLKSSEFCYLGSIVTKSGDYHTKVVERIQK